MFFSERFQISSELLKEYGAVDISLVCDIPLFIDPMLIFNSEKEKKILRCNILTRNSLRNFQLIRHISIMKLRVL